MGKYPRLQRRGGRYYLRAKVPDELVSIIGKREIVRSLGTGDYRQAVARLQVENVKVDAEISVARRKANARPLSELSDFDLTQMAILWFHRVERDDFGSPSVAPIEEDDFWIAPDVGGLPNKTLAGAVTDGAIQRTEERIADGLLKELGVEVDPEGEQYAKLCVLIRRAVSEHLKRQHDRKRGDYSAKPHDVLFEGVTEASGAPEVPRPTITFQALVDLYMNNAGRRNVREKTRLGQQSIYALLGELIGADKDVQSITRADCREVVSVLTRLPPNYTKRFPSASARQAADHAAETGLAPIAPKTANSYLINLSSMFKWAVREEFMEKNPAEAMSIADPVADEDKRQPLSLDQLNAIFGSEKFAVYRNSNRPSRFFVPLIYLFQGMRMSESCQLLTDDVMKVDGIWCFRISPSIQAGEEKAIKSASARRTIPVHPELIKLGLLEHRKKMAAEGQKRLFPEIDQSVHGARSHPFSKWFTRFMKDLGIKTPKTSLHSLRHNFRDACRSANLSKEVTYALGGWKRTQDGNGEVYGSGFPMKALKAELSKVRYKGLRLSLLDQK